MQEFDEDELEAELDALGEELELEEQEELEKSTQTMAMISTVLSYLTKSLLQTSLSLNGSHYQV